MYLKLKRLWNLPYYFVKDLVIVFLLLIVFIIFYAPGTPAFRRGYWRVWDKWMDIIKRTYLFKSLK